MLKENIKNIIQSQVPQIEIISTIFNAAIKVYYFCLLLLDDHVAILHTFFIKKLLGFGKQ